MQRGVVVRSKLHGRHIELDEGIDEFEGDVEVFVRAAPEATPPPPDVLDIVATLPKGSRSKADIDRALAEERAAWADSG